MATPSQVSPLAVPFPDIPAVAGLGLATAATGSGYRGRDDVLLMACAQGTQVAGLQTQNTLAGWPVRRNRGLLPGQARGLLVNAGNANVSTGEAGRTALNDTVRATARALGCADKTVLTASTGVIGEPPGLAPIVEALPALAKQAGGPAAPQPWEAASRAIGTTDTFPKGAWAEAAIAGTPVRLAGIAKGSGMIAPDMATMLGYVVTDADLPAEVLQACLEPAVQDSFNCVTVDGETSTSDMALAFATGRAGNPVPARADTAELAGFREALAEVCRDLAIQIARDGEGAEKLITVRVTGAADDAAARRLAHTIANSPLVKTAIAGADANWGRVVMAAGRSGEALDPDRLGVAFGGVSVGPDIEADEAALTDRLRRREVTLAVDAGVGSGEGRVWTCDLTERYIHINTSYRS